MFISMLAVAVGVVEALAVVAVGTLVLGVGGLGFCGVDLLR
jgi:hypothetical protein